MFSNVKRGDNRPLYCVAEPHGIEVINNWCLRSDTGMQMVRVVSGANDETIKVWNVRSATPVLALNPTKTGQSVHAVR
ncbi:hypothetical protein BDR05DRAFT_966031 [Suillus weaverae]|nr:hypothetical protein BDR05DRAFT_966031 [Suillus weaverae]